MENDRSLQASSNNYLVPSGMTSDLSRFMNIVGSDYRTRSFSAGAIYRNATGITIESPRIDFNLAREQCHCCKEYFADRAMLERHMRDVARTCTRCKKEAWYTCQMGLGAWTSHAYCNYGCEEHGCCFNRQDEMHEHARARGHKRCFFEDCTSGYKYGCWDEYQIMEHIRRNHQPRPGDKIVRRSYQKITYIQ